VKQRLLGEGEKRRTMGDEGRRAGRQGRTDLRGKEGGGGKEREVTDGKGEGNGGGGEGRNLLYALIAERGTWGNRKVGAPHRRMRVRGSSKRERGTRGRRNVLSGATREGTRCTTTRKSVRGVKLEVQEEAREMREGGRGRVNPKELGGGL